MKHTLSINAPLSERLYFNPSSVCGDYEGADGHYIAYCSAF